MSQTLIIKDEANFMENKTNKTFEKGKIKKAKQTKDKRGAKKTMGLVQGISQNFISEYLLHLWANTAFGFELAHGSLMEQGFTWSLSEIRHQGSPSTVLQLQYKPRGNGSRLLRKNAKRNRLKGDGKAGSRSASNSKSNGSLPKTPSRLSKDFRRIKN